ncbi:MAG: twin-arginine translocase subunit TatC [Thermodesulfobacteriota bacterium]
MVEQHLDAPPAVRLARVITSLRRSLLTVLAVFSLATVGFYSLSKPLLRWLQERLHQRLAFFSVAEPFLAHVKIAMAMATFCCMPLLVVVLWRALAKPFGLNRASVLWFSLFTCLLFYSGTAFCALVTLPYGIGFLLEFQGEQLQAVISISHFVTFVAIFILAFGVIFELPIFMVFTAKAGIIHRRTFERNRRYAVLLISIVAALLTPTPDVVNMMLMGIPLYLLYEAGIFVLKVIRIS